MQRVSNLRDLNKYDYSADIRPYILTSVNENNTYDSQNFTSGGSGGIFSGNVNLGNLDELNITTLTVEELEASTINTFELTTQFISSFVVKAGNDVRFLGTDDEGFKKLFWDSSESNLYIDGGFQFNHPHLKMHNASDDRDIDQDKYDSDIGVLFKYYDTNAHGSKYGFFGFEGTSHRFSIKESILSQEDRKIITDGTPQSLIIGNMEINELYVTSINQIENANSTFQIKAQNNNDIDIISGGDLNFYGNNMNFNISSGYSLVNNNSNTSFLNTSGDINLIAVTGDVNLDVDHGDIDILVDGNSTNQIVLHNTKGDIQILTGSTETDSILLDTDGGIQLNISDSFSINTTTNDSLSFNSVNGLTSTVPKENFNKWISFYKFNTFNGFYFTDRDYDVNLGVTLPKHYWKKEKQQEKSIIFTDIELSNRNINQKGMKLEEIFFGYRVEDDNLNNILVRLTKKKFDYVSNNYQLNVTNIPYNDINLDTGITQGYDYYGGIEITNPFFLNDESILNIELEIDTPSNSLFKFYGCNLKFSRNDL